MTDKKTLMMNMGTPMTRKKTPMTNTGRVMTHKKMQMTDMGAPMTNKLGETNLPELVPYDYSITHQTVFMQAITDFNFSIAAPRVNTIDNKQNTVQLGIAFDKVDAALGNIDVLVDVLKLTKPEFYTSYKSARKIINLSSRPLLVKGLVTDASTGEGLRNVNVTFELNGNTTGLMKASASAKTETLAKKTAEKGGFSIKSLPEGSYSVTVRKIGYADLVTTLNVTNGDLAVLNVELVKN